MGLGPDLSDRGDDPTAVDHAGADRAGVGQHGFMPAGFFSSVRNGDKVGEGARAEFANAAGLAQGAGSVDRGHAEDFFRRHGGVFCGQRAHFLKHVEGEFLFAAFADGGQAVSAQANVDPGTGKALALEGRVAEIIVAAWTMDDVDVVPAEQLGITPGEEIDVDGQEMFAEQAMAFEMLDG